MKHHKVTRVEVIDQTGRAYVNMNAGEVEIMLQDDDRTLKVFTKGGKERMFTESEVRAMLERFSANLSGMSEFADEHYTSASRETTANNVRAVRRHLGIIAAKHFGITL